MKTFTLHKRGSDSKILPPTAEGFRDRPWYFRFQFRGVAFSRCTETNVADDAQKQARRVRDQLLNSIHAAEHSRGRTFSKTELRAALKSGDLLACADATKLRHTAAATLGEIFPLYRKHARCDPKTIENNIGSFVNVLRRGLGKPDWSYEDICRQSCAVLTKRLVKDFQDAMTTGAGEDFTAQDRAATNANSLLRQARSLFADRRKNNLLEYYAEAGLKLPDTLTGFKTAALLDEPDHTFEPPSPEFLARLHAAAPALRASDPNAYRIYLLALGCGLRKKEIAFLCGSHVHHDPAGNAQHVIELKTRTNFRTKNRKPRWVPMESYIWQELITLSPLLDAPRSADPLTPLEDYLLEGDAKERYQASFHRFGLWLKSLGWNRQKKAHELRKVWESQAGLQFGSRVASKLAGHTVEVHESNYFGMHKHTLPAVNIFGAQGQ